MIISIIIGILIVILGLFHLVYFIIPSLINTTPEMHRYNYYKRCGDSIQKSSNIFLRQVEIHDNTVITFDDGMKIKLATGKTNWTDFVLVLTKKIKYINDKEFTNGPFLILNENEKITPQGIDYSGYQIMLNSNLKEAKVSLKEYEKDCVVVIDN